MTLDYKIPKIEAKVLILFDQDTGEPTEYSIFLNEFSRYRKGQESISEFLNKDRGFIPVKNTATGEYSVANINHIVYLIDQKEFQTTDEPKHVSIDLINNRKLEAEHFKPMPDSQSRLLDFLNEQSKFVVFGFNGHKIFINKNKIVNVKG